MTPREETANLIKKSDSIGIALPEKPSLDDAATGLALKRALLKLGKKAAFLFSGDFPKIIDDIVSAENSSKTESPIPRDFIIKINTEASPIKELRYEKSGGSMKIILAPQNIPIKKEDVAFADGAAHYDLIIALGARNLEDLGKTFKESPDVFYERPVISIDTRVDGETFAEVNLVEPNKSSIAEIVSDFLLKFFPEAVEENTATLLLLGVITKTKNLQNNRTKPATLSIAAELIAGGAKKDEIVRALWKTKPLPLLQIWGRASVRSRLDGEKGILWSVLTKDDFAKTQTFPEEAIPFVLDHTEEHFSLPETFVILWQRIEDGMIQALIRTATVAPPGGELAAFGLRENCRIFKTAFPSFSEAETAILALLSN